MGLSQSTIALGQIQGRKAAALVGRGQLDDLIVDPPADTPQPEAIYRAKITRVLAQNGGAFVDLPSGPGYLRRPTAQRGDSVMVQVTGLAEPGKAIPLTDRPLIKGRTAIAAFDESPLNLSRKIADPATRGALKAEIAAAFPDVRGVILRAEALEAEADTRHAELSDLLALRDTLLATRGTAPALLHPGADAHVQARRDWPQAEMSDFAAYEVEDLIAAMRSPEVALGPGSATIEPTRAFVAIDVNTGADTSPAAGLKANLALARDLPRQLRCRGLGGQIVIDMAPMPKSQRGQVEKALGTALRADPIPTEIVGWTPLGHMELQRKRARVPLHSVPM
ncbi:MAG: ribonuclease E/G [Pseudomonadota bacterium]